MNEQILYITVGTPGCGKSFYTATNLADVPHYEADMYFMHDGVYQFKIEELLTAHKWCQDKVWSELLTGNSCVVSNTNLTPQEMQAYFNMVREIGTNIKIEVIEFKYINTEQPDEESIFNSLHFDNYSDDEKLNIYNRMKSRDNVHRRIGFYMDNKDIIKTVKLHTLYRTKDTYIVNIKEFII
jgi:hypothetical protein